jgi:thiol-disulfide isomerase/thioredoxin
MSVIKLKASDIIIHNNLVFVKNNDKPFIIFFKADWCGHCVRFTPTYNQLSLRTTSFNFYELENEELEKSPRIAEILKIQGFPSLFFGNAKGLIVEEYQGSRSIDELITKIKSVCKYCVRS